MTNWKLIVPEDKSLDALERCFQSCRSVAEEIPGITDLEMVGQLMEIVGVFHPKAQKAYTRIEFNRRSKESMKVEEAFEIVLHELC